MGMHWMHTEGWQPIRPACAASWQNWTATNGWQPINPALATLLQNSAACGQWIGETDWQFSQWPTPAPMDPDESGMHQWTGWQWPVELWVRTPQNRDIFVRRRLQLGMDRKQFIKHIKKVLPLPRHRDLRAKLLLAWWKVTGEGPRSRVANPITTTISSD